ncbi:antitoxin [Pseudarthrobacter sp. NamE5]|uniref:antitoxin n=1 Tax=Pseudarthrobacter sp. NamE5 TaxID=2576839 RepID=UPI00110A5C86|nr:antitoxin [Pseudarthrobacter sp. NamE5]TLM83776.1 antitoxin [Pseudarthrobacter sp. NamE5]
MGLFGDLKGKAQGLIHGNEQAIKNGISKAGDLVDAKTGRKYSGHIDKIQHGASKLIDKNGTPGQAPAAGQVPPVPPVNPVPPADRTP